MNNIIIIKLDMNAISNDINKKIHSLAESRSKDGIEMYVGKNETFYVTEVGIVLGTAIVVARDGLHILLNNLSDILPLNVYSLTKEMDGSGNEIESRSIKPLFITDKEVRKIVDKPLIYLIENYSIGEISLENYIGRDLIDDPRIITNVMILKDSIREYREMNINVN
jgi:hypothetical protein